MQFDVKFYPYKQLFAAQQQLRFFGKGVVFLHDTGIIFQGNSPKLDVWGLDELLGKPLFAITTRTVPYSTILRYRHPRFFHKRHEIIYKLPDNKKCLISFSLMNKTYDLTLKNKINEYVTVNKFYS